MIFIIAHLSLLICACFDTIPIFSVMFNNATNEIRVYVGNLPYTMRNEDLFKMFALYGKVADVVVMMEPDDPNRSKGFGFVTMTNKLEAEKAIKMINGKEILGREIVCNIAKPREPRFRF